MTRRWVVAHDGTPESEGVVAVAARHARLHGVGLLLVHAVSHERLHDDLDWSDGASAPLTFEEYAAGADTEAELSLRASSAAALARANGLSVEVLVVPGEPADAILAVAGRPEIERVVMGTHARRGLRHLVLGSVAERVIAKATVPVLVVPPRV
ncbi:MAG: universal stress protein [Myxococcota bacterium]